MMHSTFTFGHFQSQMCNLTFNSWHLEAWVAFGVTWTVCVLPASNVFLLSATQIEVGVNSLTLAPLTGCL